MPFRSSYNASGRPFALFLLGIFRKLQKPKCLNLLFMDLYEFIMHIDRIVQYPIARSRISVYYHKCIRAIYYPCAPGVS